MPVLVNSAAEVYLSVEYLLAVGEGIWTAFLLESLMEARLGLHPLADIVDHTNGQALRTLHLENFTKLIQH